MGCHLVAEFVCLGVSVGLGSRFSLLREAGIRGLRFPPYTKPILPCVFLPAWLVPSSFRSCAILPLQGRFELNEGPSGTRNFDIKIDEF